VRADDEAGQRPVRAAVREASKALYNEQRYARLREAKTIFLSFSLETLVVVVSRHRLQQS
jgi:hypothetical protein